MACTAGTVEHARGGAGWCRIRVRLTVMAASPTSPLTLLTAILDEASIAVSFDSDSNPEPYSIL